MCATRENYNCKCSYKPNSSSMAMMISTWSKLSSPKSFMKWDVTWSCTEIMKTTFKSSSNTEFNVKPKLVWMISITYVVDLLKLTVYLPSRGWSCHKASGRRAHGHGQTLGLMEASHRTASTERPETNCQTPTKHNKNIQLEMCYFRIAHEYTNRYYYDCYFVPF